MATLRSANLTQAHRASLRVLGLGKSGGMVCITMAPASLPNHVSQPHLAVTFPSPGTGPCHGQSVHPSLHGHHRPAPFGSASGPVVAVTAVFAVRAWVRMGYLPQGLITRLRRSSIRAAAPRQLAVVRFSRLGWYVRMGDVWRRV